MVRQPGQFQVCANTMVFYRKAFKPDCRVDGARNTVRISSFQRASEV